MKEPRVGSALLPEAGTWVVKLILGGRMLTARRDPKIDHVGGAPYGRGVQGETGHPIDGSIGFAHRHEFLGGRGGLDT